MKRMRKLLSMVLASTMVVGLGSVVAGTDGAGTVTAEASPATNIAAGEVDKSEQQRIIITTDLEVDDQNGVLLSLMYSTDYDLAGIVWTAGMYHFNGDGGEHTLADITPNYKCEATTAGGTVENAGELTEFRPVDPDLLDHICDLYAEDYEYLSQNSELYPTPDYIRSICVEGNIQFEGDTRYDTEGSELIKSCILDDDMRPLYIMHWGGFNTTARALISIYEEYHDTNQWEEVYNKVITKVRLVGSGEDNCREDSKVDEMFPGLQSSDRSSFGSYGQYFSALLKGDTSLPAFYQNLGTNATLNPYYQGEYLTEAFKLNHGALLGEFHLMGDGQEIYGEPDIYQYGLNLYIDWATAGEQGWAGSGTSIFTRVDFDQYDWMCCQFGTVSFIELGLRQDVTNSNDHYVELLFEELAARADWAICTYDECNHAPIVDAETLDYTVTAGSTVTLSGTASDPDGDELEISWWIPENACTYTSGSTEDLSVAETGTLTTTFTVPEDAVAGDTFVVNMEVSDTDVERPMTRFAQFVITVEEESEPEPAGETGVIKVDGTWGYYVDGVLQEGYYGFQENAYGIWYIEDGYVTFKKNGVIQDTEGTIGTKGTWYYVTNSEVRTDYTGVADYKNDAGWWYIKNGVVDFSANTVAKNKYGWWYVVGGKVQFGYTGVANYSNSSGWWYIKNGKVDFTANTVAKNNYGWRKVTNGKVDFSFTGIASNSYGSWLIKNGKVNFSYSGRYRYNGKTYKISGGKVC